MWLERREPAVNQKESRRPKGWEQRGKGEESRIYVHLRLAGEQDSLASTRNAGDLYTSTGTHAHARTRTPSPRRGIGPERPQSALRPFYPPKRTSMVEFETERQLLPSLVGDSEDVAALRPGGDRDVATTLRRLYSPQSRRIARALHREGTSRGDRVDLRQLRDRPLSPFWSQERPLARFAGMMGSLSPHTTGFSNHLEPQARSQKPRGPVAKPDEETLKLTH